MDEKGPMRGICVSILYARVIFLRNSQNCIWRRSLVAADEVRGMLLASM